MSSFDAIVIGAGHNGLVCAATLAKKGRSVLVVEAADTVGGLVQDREFHAGFKAPIAHAASSFSTQVAKALDLPRHGLDFEPAGATYGLGEDGAHVRIVGDQISGVPQADHDEFAAYRQKLLRYAKTLDVVWHNTMPRIGGGLMDAMVYAQAALKLRLLGAEDMSEFVRVLTLPMRDLIDEVFVDPKLQGLLSWDGVIGSKLAPRSPNNAVLPLLLRMNGAAGGDYLVPKGGMRAIAASLVSAAQAAGAQIRTSSPVKRIIIEGDENGERATGVELETGEVLHAKKVISSADPKTTLFKLLGQRHLEIEFTNRIKRLRTNGLVAKFHIALSGEPEIVGGPDLRGRFIIAPSFDAIEFAYDDAKYGEASADPAIEFTVPSAVDGALAPAGQHVVSANVMYAPYDEKTGWSDASRAAFSDAIIAKLKRYIPNLDQISLGHELLTPLDLEREYRVTGGHWHHAEMALEQMLMMRPTYQAAQYQTPVSGLHLCGAGSHPGGGVLGIPGWNAARQILK